MQFHEVSFRQRFGAFEDAAGKSVGVAHFPFFAVRHRLDAQGQQLVDFGSVEEIAGAFRREARVIVENDGRGEDGVAGFVFVVAHEDRPDAEVLAGLGDVPMLRGRIHQGKKLAARDLENGMGGGEGARQDRLAVLQQIRRHGCLVGDADPNAEEAGQKHLDAGFDPARQRFRMAHEHSGELSVRFDRLAFSFGRKREWMLGSGGWAGEVRAGDVTFHGFLPGLVERAVDPQLGHWIVGRLYAFSPASRGVVQLSDFAPDGLEKSNADGAERRRPG